MKYDCGILLDAPSYNDIVNTQLVQDCFVVIDNNDHPLLQRDTITTTDLLTCHFIIPKRDIPAVQHLMDLFVFYGKRPHFDYESNDAGIIKRAVMACDRIALLPRLTVKDSIDQKQLAEIALK